MRLLQRFLSRLTTDCCLFRSASPLPSTPSSCYQCSESPGTRPLIFTFLCSFCKWFSHQSLKLFAMRYCTSTLYIMYKQGKHKSSMSWMHHSSFKKKISYRKSYRDRCKVGCCHPYLYVEDV